MEYKTLSEYPDYHFLEDGNVYSKRFNRLLAKNHKGHYVSLALKNVNGKFDSVSRHRVMARAWHGEPVYPRNVVHHINEIPGDDRPENLRWVTTRENLFASCKRTEKLRMKPISVSVMDAETGFVKHYPSVGSAAKDLGLPNWTVILRVRKGDDIVYPDGKRYRITSDQPWIEETTDQFGKSLGVDIKDIETGDVVSFETQREAGEFLNLNESSMHVRLNDYDQPLINYRYLIKHSSDERPWRVVNDPLTDNNYLRPVVAFDVKNNKAHIYASCRACAKDRGLKVTTLSERLKLGDKNKVWKDGFRYMYYG